MGGGLKRGSAIENQIVGTALSMNAIGSIAGTAQVSAADSQDASFKNKSTRLNSEITRAGNKALAAKNWLKRSQRAFSFLPRFDGVLAQSL